MALSRFHPFVFPSIFDDVFDTPTTFFPRGLTVPDEKSATSSSSSSWRHPGYHVHEDDKTYTVSIDVPGVRPEDMNISIEENTTLRVHGGRKIEKKDGVAESKFDYRLNLGDGVDMEKIQANLDSGVLSLTAPKKVPLKPEPRRIPITSGPAPKSLEVENDGKKQS